MDSTLLAAAYSSRYKYIDKEHIECLKTYSSPEQDDALAKARRLSQETNKRRKVAAQKRKQEQEREEKRRQEILNKRHQEQKQATEKYQRSHVSARPRHSPSHRSAHSPRRTHSHMDLDEALRLVRGSSAPSTRSAPDTQSHEAIQRMYQQQENARDPLDRSHHVRTRRSRSAHRHGHSQHHAHHKQRPLSGNPLDASMRVELMERSMRNLTSSRSRFEQQLEQHQQLLVEQQQKSLHEFNQAIRREIDADTKVQGVEEDQADNDNHEGLERSESLSSLDSLEEEEGRSSKRQDHQDLRVFHQAAEQQRDERHLLQAEYNRGGNSFTTTDQTNGRAGAEPVGYPQCQQHQSAVRPQSAKAAAGLKSQMETGGNAGSAGNAHVVGPIPQGYYTSTAGASSTPVIMGNLSHHCPDSLDAGQPSPERRVGTALRLPQQQPASVSQPVKQAAPPLQYNSQLLAHRQFEPRPNYSSPAVTSKQFSGGGDGGSDNTPQTGGVTCGGNPSAVTGNPCDTTNNTPPATEQPTSALTQNEQPWERPKAHIYAWSSPPPVEDEQEAGFAAHNGHANKQATAYYSEEMGADRVMATNLHPHTNRNMNTAATATWIYQTVNTAPNRQPTYSQVNTGSTPHTNQSSSGAPHVEIPRGQGEKPGSNAAGGVYQAHTSVKFVASMPPSFQSQHASDSRQRGQAPESQAQSKNHAGRDQNGSASQQQHHREGSASQNTLNLVNSRLHVVDIGQPKITVVEEQSGGVKEVRGILKKSNRTAQSQVAAGGPKFNVQDSLEITKRHMQLNAETKKTKVKRKGVRFADLHYADAVDEDTDSADSMTEASLAAAAKDGSGDGKLAVSSNRVVPPQRQRPASARVGSTVTKATDSNKVKGPRVASAGPSARPAQASRPKAAAHIIMSGEAVNHPYHHGNDAGAGITVHKSQLDKKVTLINNNFMSRIPAYSSAAAATVATASMARSGSTAAPSTAAGNAAVNAAAAGATNAYSKTSSYGQAGKTSSAPPPPQTTVLPSHSHFTNANNNGYKVVYNENGMRIDRTPTDDEINNLWKNMRTMLDVSEKGVTSQPSSATTTNATTTTTATHNNSNNSDLAAKSQAQVSHQYMDGASLGIPNGMTRVGSMGFAATASSAGGVGPKSAGGNNAMPQPAKNGYLQRYSLLQQRRNVASGIGTAARTNNGIVEQTVQPMNQINGNGAEHWHSAVNISYAPRGEEMSESMAGFLAAEQLVTTHGADVHESKVVAAMESAQNQQEMYNSIRQKVARGGPSALSMEEHRLLESLDKLNERLNAVENRATSGQNGSHHGNASSNHQVYVHGPGFRGHQIIPRRSSAGVTRPSGRPVSARLLTRPHH